MAHQLVVVLDFGSQYTQLIARRIREQSVYCEIHPYTAASEIARLNPIGIVLSGGPNSVYEEGAPTISPELYARGIPILGICFGAQVGEDGRVICGLSGGVDSSVAAALIHRAIGDRLTCIFVDNGVLRRGEREQVAVIFRDHFHVDLRVIDAEDRFLDRLADVTDPEKKRKIIGNEFIAVFEEQAKTIEHARFLAQGTLYPDVIESVSFKGPSHTINSHHNVGGLPERMQLALVEPLRELFKDEVRQLGLELGLPRHMVWRQPFPGPGLAVRCLGNLTKARLDVLRAADAIVEEEIRAAGLYESIWQSFGVLLPVKSVGVMGDARTYEEALAVRAVHSRDGMTADWVQLPYDVLARISSRVINEVRGINRVVYDVTSKPPGTIEWE